MTDERFSKLLRGACELAAPWSEGAYQVCMTHLYNNGYVGMLSQDARSELSLYSTAHYARGFSNIMMLTCNGDMSMLAKKSSSAREASDTAWAVTLGGYGWEAAAILSPYEFIERVISDERKRKQYHKRVESLGL